MSKIWNSLSVFISVADLNMQIISFWVIVAYSILFHRVGQNSMEFTWSPYYLVERQRHREKFETVRMVSTTDLTEKRNFLKHDNIALKIKLIKWGSRVQHNDMKILTYLKGLMLSSSWEIRLYSILPGLKIPSLFCFVGKASFIS
jgi:hypothetical protein